MSRFRPVRGGPPVRLDVAMAVTAAASAGFTFDRAFVLSALLVVVPVAAVTPALGLSCGTALHRLGWQFVGAGLRTLVYLCSLGLLLVVVTGAMVDLFSLTLPAPAEPALLVVPVAFTWIGTALGTELAGRGGLVVLLPSAPAWVCGSLLAPPTDLDFLFAVVTAGCVATQLIRSAAPGRTGWRWMAWPAAALLATTAIAALAVFAGSAHQHGEPFDARDHLPYAELPTATVNPLDQVDGWLTDPGRLLFRASTDGPARYWRLAVLDHFDGEQWLPPSRYTLAGLGVPAAAGPPAPTTAIRQSVTIEDLRGHFLPGVERPVRIGPPVFAVETDSGVLLAEAAVHKGLSYTLSSRLGPTRDVSPTCDGEPASSVAVPPELVDGLLAVTGNERCSGSFATFADAVADRLTAGRRNIEASPSAGTSIGAIAAFLRTGGAGTPVEFAAAFALAMRATGLSSRLVVGFEPPGGATGGAVVVHARDVRIWIDVLLPGHGWVAYHLGLPEAAPVDRPSRVDRPPPSPSLSIGPSPAPSGSTSGGPNPPPPGSWDPTWLMLTVLAPVVTYLCAVLAAPPLRRRWRRRPGSSRRRGLAAWHDVLDELAYRPAGHATAGEIRVATPASTVVLVRKRCLSVGDAVADLAGTAEVCLYTNREPDPAMVKRAWRAAEQVRRGLRRRISRTGRIRRLLTPANLRPGWW